MQEFCLNMSNVLWKQTKCDGGRIELFLWVVIYYSYASCVAYRLMECDCINPENVHMLCISSFLVVILFSFSHPLLFAFPAAVWRLYFWLAVLASSTTTLLCRNNCLHKLSWYRERHWTSEVSWLDPIPCMCTRTSYLNYASEERCKKRANTFCYWKNYV